jgi:hypothetical protein
MRHHVGCYVALQPSLHPCNKYPSCASLSCVVAGDVFRSVLMGGVMDAGWPKAAAPSSQHLVRFTSRVKSVGPGSSITLERRLPWEVKQQWGPQLHAVKPRVVDAGLEAMTLEFKWSQYRGHLKEDGLNAVMFNQMAQRCGWRDLTSGLLPKS